MEFGRSKNCFGIMKDNKKTVNKNLGIIKFCDLSGHAKYVHKSKIDNFFSMTTKASKCLLNVRNALSFMIPKQYLDIKLQNVCHLTNPPLKPICIFLKAATITSKLIQKKIF